MASNNPRLPNEVLEIILCHNLVSSVPFVDPKPRDKCSHAHASIPDMTSTYQDPMGLVECLQARYGRGKVFQPAKVDFDVLLVSKRFYDAGRPLLYNENFILFTEVETLRCFYESYPVAAKSLKNVIAIARLSMLNLWQFNDPLGRPEKPLFRPAILQDYSHGWNWDDLMNLTVHFTGWKGTWFKKQGIGALSCLNRELSDRGLLEEGLQEWQLQEKCELQELCVLVARANNANLCQHELFFQEWLRGSMWKAERATVTGLEDLLDSSYVKGCMDILKTPREQVDGPVRDHPKYIP